MPRLNQNQPIQALTMLARGDNVSNVSRAFGCHRNTIIRLRQRFRGSPIWSMCLQHVIGLPVCSGHNGISVRGDNSGLGFYSLTSLGLTLVIITVEFEFLEEEGNALLIIVSLRGTDFEVGVLWYGVALWAEGKQILLLCKTASMLKVTLTRFCSLKLFISFKAWACNIDA